MVGNIAGWDCVRMLRFLSGTPAYKIIGIVKAWQITHAGVCAGVCVCARVCVCEGVGLVADLLLSAAGKTKKYLAWAHARKGHPPTPTYAMQSRHNFCILGLTIRVCLQPVGLPTRTPWGYIVWDGCIWGLPRRAYTHCTVEICVCQQKYTSF